MTGLWLLLGLFWAQLCRAQDTYTVYEAVERHLANFAYTEARQSLALIQNYPYRQFYELHVRFVEAMVHQTDYHTGQFLRESEEFLGYMSTQNTRTRDGLMAEVYLERGLVKFLSASYLSAVNDLRQAQRLVRAQQRTDPSWPFPKRISGIMKVALGTVPKKYQWVIRSLGWEANLQEGLAELKAAAKPGQFLGLETEVLLYYVDRNLTNDTTAARLRIDSLSQRLPDALFVRYLAAGNALDRGNGDLALAMLEAYKQLDSEAILKRFPYFFHLLGRLHLFKENHLAAIEYLERFLSQSKSPMLRQDALFKLAMAEALAHRTTAAKAHLTELLSQKSSNLGEDGYARTKARYFLQFGFRVPEMELMRARYLYDGGYYDRALKVLDELALQLATLDFDYKCELYYRYGRVFHARNRIERALSYYNLSRQQTSTRNRWMQAYSTYYIAQLLEQQADWQNARYHYRRVLDFDGYEYQDALEQKAKAALDRLKDKTYDIEPGP